MSEVRLIVILVTTLVLLGGGTWTGYHFTAQHYEIVMAKDKAAQEKVVEEKQAQIIALQKERADTLAKEATDHEERVQADAATRAVIDDRMRGLSGSLRAVALSTAVAATPGGLGAGAIPCSPSGLSASSPAINAARAGVDQALAGWNAANDKLIGAGQHDAREVTGILQVAPVSTPPRTHP